MNKNVKTDLYGKIVLTIIASCLLLITFNLYFSPKDVTAYQTVQDVNIKSINGQSLWGDELPINIKELNGRSINNSMPVDIQSVRGRDLWDNQIPVDIQKVNGSQIYGSEVPVKIK
jgi:hypothetical protein